MAPPDLYVQRDQPPGVPPLHLTGERTLPDVPEENYWYRRHLAVYEWIAQRVHGRRVVDLACGEGYGSARARRATAASVVGVDANPDAFEHARLKYTGGNVSLRARHDRDLDRRRRLRRVPADDRARAGSRRGARRGCATWSGPAASPTSRRRTCSRSRRRARSAPATRGTCASTGPEEYRALCERHFGRVDLLGLFHARKLRAAPARDRARRLGRDPRAARRHASRSTTASRPRSPSATSALRRGALDGALDLLAVLRP